MMKLYIGIVFASLILSALAIAQPAGFNYDEAKAGTYSLPDPLVTISGKRVTDAETWNNVRRPEILQLLETNMYGRSPGKPEKMTFELNGIDAHALGGKAVRKQVTASFFGNGKSLPMDILIYVPTGVKGPVPVFLGLNFGGNHTVHSDPGITLSKRWTRTDPVNGVIHASAKDRGSAASRWQVEKILERGYGLATIYYGDITPDHADRFQDGVHPLFYKPGQTKPEDGEWGAVAAWAWGLSRAMDYLATDKDVDASRVAVVGHSRIGKTALWAGAHDPRFAMVIAIQSGEGGAALSKRNFGETVERINTSFPHWFAGNYKKFNGKEAALPFDSHMLIALIAPRPIYVSSAQEDVWSDPRGEFLGARNADPVYALFGKKGLGANAMPAVHQPIMNTIGYHIREGKHEVTAYDWDRYLDFADKQLRPSAAN